MKIRTMVKIRMVRDRIIQRMTNREMESQVEMETIIREAVTVAMEMSRVEMGKKMILKIFRR